MLWPLGRLLIQSGICYCHRQDFVLELSSIGCGHMMQVERSTIDEAEERCEPVERMALPL